ncbi:MAG: restriction endonuclease [Sphingomicrobium sp.]
MKAPRPGIALQNLVAALERVLSQQAGVTIESPRRLRDKDTGQLREHDVCITRRHAHHTILTGIEVKDTGRKAGVPEVEAFAKKCEKTGVHHRVLVSASGFTKTARTKAAALDIVCMELSEVDSFDWMAVDFFVQIDRQIPHIDARVFFKATKPSEPFRVYDANKVEMTPSHLANVVYMALDKNGLTPPVDQDTPVSVRALTEGWFGVGEDGEEHEIDFLELFGTISVRQSTNPVRLHSYTGPDANYAVATTDVTLGNVAGQIVFIRDAEHVQVAWSPNPTQSKDK